MVGAAGLILTNIMCKAMNRSLISVLMGGVGATTSAPDLKGAQDYDNVKSIGAEERGVGSVIIVPGYLGRPPLLDRRASSHHNQARQPRARPSRQLALHDRPGAREAPPRLPQDHD